MIGSPYDQTMQGGRIPGAYEPEPERKHSHWWQRALDLASMIPGPQQPFVAGADMAVHGAQEGTHALMDPAIWAAVLAHMPKAAGPGFTQQTWSAAGGIRPPGASPLTTGQMPMDWWRRTP